MSGIVGKNVGRGSGVVTATPVGADAVSGANIADDAIDSEHYADGSIDNAHIADDAIDSEHYADGSIDNAHIADDAIDSEHYAAGSIDEAHIANNAITLAKMAGNTDGVIITFNASGDPVAVGPGSDGQVLTSTGAGSPPAFEAAGGGGVDSITDNGTEEAINIDSNEIVTMPKQPGFDAYVNANQVDETGDGTAFAITGAIWTELSDKNADFSNGTFTAPVSGLYSFTAMVSLVGTTTSTTLIDLNFVFSNADRRAFLSNNYGAVTGTNFIISQGLIAFMDASDTVSLLFTASGTGKLVDIGHGDDSRTTRFSGVLLP